MGKLLHLPNLPRRIPTSLVLGLPRPGKEDFFNQVSELQDALQIKVLDARSAPFDSLECTACQIEQIFEQLTQNQGANTKSWVFFLPENIDPLALADTFRYRSLQEHPLLRVSSVTSVIDAASFWDDLAADDWEFGDPPSRPFQGIDTAELLLSQVEWCDTVVLARSDQASEKDLARIEQTLRRVQIQAPFYRHYGSVPEMSEILLQKRFHAENILQGAAWRHALQEARTNEHIKTVWNPAQGYLVYRRRRPFHPGRLHEVLYDWPEDVLRTFGTIWLASNQDLAFTFSQAGPCALSFSPEGKWLAGLEESEQQWALSRYPELGETWCGSFGDRVTELTLIGESLNRLKIVESLDTCLLNDNEMRQDWASFPNPFSEQLSQSNPPPQFLPHLKLVPNPEPEKTP